VGRRKKGGGGGGGDINFKNKMKLKRAP